MDFSNRDIQPQNGTPSAQPIVAGGQNHGPANTKKARHEGSEKGDWARVITVILVAALVILLCAVIALISNANNDKTVASESLEGSYVKTDKLQAVFLNNDQVYFGKIKELNSKYLILANVYYIQPAAADAAGAAKNTATLVKMGCELHEPYDQLVVNRDQVTFWENLQDNGQVAKGVAKLKKCVDQSSSSSSTSNTTQPATTKTNP